MSSQQDVASTREKLIWTALLAVASTFGFLYVDMRNAASFGHGRALLALETSLDARVPFLPEFIFAYVLYYPWLMLPTFVLRTREVFYRALGAFALMQLLAQTVFVLFPSHIVRPQVEGDGLAAALLRLVYSLDLGWNLFPSLHVGHSLLVALLVTRNVPRGIAISVWAGTLLIWTSTVLVKQHYVIDIVGGALLGWFCYAIACRPLPVIRRLVWQKGNQS